MGSRWMDGMVIIDQWSSKSTVGAIKNSQCERHSSSRVDFVTFSFKHQNVHCTYPRFSSPVTLGLAGEDRYCNHDHPRARPPVLHQVLFKLRTKSIAAKISKLVGKIEMWLNIYHDVPQLLIEDLVAGLDYSFICCLK